MPVLFSADIMPDSFTISANPESGLVRMSMPCGTGVVNIIIKVDDSTMELPKLIEAALKRARSGLITPGAALKGIAGHS